MGFGDWLTRNGSPASAVIGGLGGLANYFGNRSATRANNRRIDDRMRMGNERLNTANQMTDSDNQRIYDLRERGDDNWYRRSELANGLINQGNTGFSRVGINTDDIDNELAGLNSRDVNERVFDEYADTGGWSPERKRLALEEGTAGARQSTGNVLNEMRRQGSATGNGLAGFLANRASRDFSRGIGDTTTSALNSINNSIDQGRQWGATGRAGLNVGNADRALAAAQARLQGRMGIADLGLRADLANQGAGLQAADLDLRRQGMGLDALAGLGNQYLNETGNYISGRNSMFGQGNSIYDSGNRLLGMYQQNPSLLQSVLGGVGSSGSLMNMFQDLRNRRTSGNTGNQSQSAWYSW
jgi:hypothetical protein